MTAAADTVTLRPAAEELHWRSGALTLFGKLWLRDAAAPAVLLLPGLGFHTFEYEELAPLLADWFGRTLGHAPANT